MRLKSLIKKTSLSAQIIGVVLLMSILLTVISTGFDLSNQYNDEVRNLETEIKQIEDGISKSVAQSLWEINEDVLRSVLEGIILLPNIHYISVADNIDEFVTEMGNKNVKEERVFTIPLFHIDKKEKKEIGILKIHTNLSGIEAKIKRRLVFVFLENLFSSAVLALFVLFAMRRLVAKPLKRLAIWSRELEKDYLINSLKQDPSKLSKDSNELVVLEKALRSMQKAHVTVIGKLKKENRDKERATAELEELNTKLEGMVADAVQKTNELQKHVMMQEKLTSLGALSSGIAHEIKNPLNFINNSSDMVETLTTELKETFDENIDKFDEEDKKELEANFAYLTKASGLIKKHGTRANEIVKSLLVQTISEQSELKETDIREIVKSSAELALTNFKQTHLINVKFDYHFEEYLKFVSIFPREFAQALINVVDNSLYSIYERHEQGEEGYKGVVDIRAFFSGDFLEIGIRDNGTGVSEEDLKRVFEPFWTTKPTGTGTGLGLSVVYDVINIHKGSVDVKSEMGSYTEITLRISSKLNEEEIEKEKAS